ncbi:hypothetical protein JOD55_000079 [Arcanobacterium pluranimalium]|nr:hypothetical protein [Arcanobacterium pluranimalium]
MDFTDVRARSFFLKTGYLETDFGEPVLTEPI